MIERRESGTTKDEAGQTKGGVDDTNSHVRLDQVLFPSKGTPIALLNSGEARGCSTSISMDVTTDRALTTCKALAKCSSCHHVRTVIT
jgi:hypothetical protein